MSLVATSDTPPAFRLGKIGDWGKYPCAAGQLPPFKIASAAADTSFSNVSPTD